MSTTKFGPLQIGIILLTVSTAVIHLALGIPNVAAMPSMWMFILNGIGYLVLVTALYLPQLQKQRSLIRWALIAFTAITIIAWAVITRGDSSAIGYVDKIIEVALIVLLFIEGRK
jgi:hypothetical protein